jgi:valyl-tRNA synthetase
MYFFKYPVEGKNGSGSDSSGDSSGSASSGSNDDFLPVATTRPETILGDSAVAVHPADPRFAHLVGCRCRVPLTDRYNALGFKRHQCASL